jgi:hypothetical protein
VSLFKKAGLILSKLLTSILTSFSSNGHLIVKEIVILRSNLD